MKRMVKAARIRARRFLDIRGYKREALAFLEFLRTVPADALTPAREGKKVGILVSPWMYTAVPWFSITLAYFYKLRGFDAFIIWDDVPFTDFGQLRDQNKVIGQVLERVASSLPSHKLTAFAPAPLDAADTKEVERLTKLNAIMKFRSATPKDDWKPFMTVVRKTISESMARSKTLLAQDGFDHLVLPGGIYGNAGVLFWAAGRKKIRVATYDCGKNTILLGVDGIAAHLLDVPKIFEPALMEKHISPVKQKVLELARKEFERRLVGADDFKYQKTVYEAGETGLRACDVLIALNVDWDAAALGRHMCFAESHEWLLETVRFIIENTNATVAVRQHPVERVPGYRCKHDLENELKALFNNSPRIHFYDAEHTVNTYNLVESSRVVLPFTSTIGIEAAMLGKHVIMESTAYYSKLPFVQFASSREKYFSLIKETLSTREALAPEKIEFANLCYYYGQLINRLFTGFTPHNDDFNVWVQNGFGALAKDPLVQSIVQALADNVPLVISRNQVYLEERHGH